MEYKHLNIVLKYIYLVTFHRVHLETKGSLSDQLLFFCDLSVQTWSDVSVLCSGAVGEFVISNCG